MSVQEPAARLEALRQDVASTDEELVRIIARRLQLAQEIGQVKEALGLPIMDPAREAEVVRRAGELARARGADPELVRGILWRIIDAARSVQDR